MISYVRRGAEIVPLNTIRVETAFGTVSGGFEMVS